MKMGWLKLMECDTEQEPSENNPTVMEVNFVKGGEHGRWFVNKIDHGQMERYPRLAGMTARTKKGLIKKIVKYVIRQDGLK